jgi:hypothetical protein
VTQYETSADGMGNNDINAATSGNQADKSASVRDALKFFFSPDGQFFRDFLLDETVKGVDALSREGLRELAATLGLRGSPLVPPVLKAMVPRLNEQDRKQVRPAVALFALLWLVGFVGCPGLVWGECTYVRGAASLNHTGASSTPTLTRHTYTRAGRERAKAPGLLPGRRR